MKKTFLCVLIVVLLLFPISDAGADDNFEGYDAVILFEKGVFDHAFTNELCMTHFQRKIKFLTQKGIDDYGTVKIYISPSKEHVSDIKGTVYLPDGTEVKLKKSDVYRKKVVRKSGKKVTEIGIVFPSLKEGAVVEYSYNKSYSGLRHITTWYFQDELYKVRSEVSFIPWPEYRYGYTMRNLILEPDMHKTRPGGNTCLNFVRENIPPRKREPHSLPYGSLTEAITFYYLDYQIKLDNFWEEWGPIFYKRYIKKLVKPCKKAKEIVASIKRDNKDIDEKALVEKLYDYAVTHYVSLDRLSKKEKEEIEDDYRKSLGKIKKSSQLFDHKYLSGYQISYLLASLIKSGLPSADVKIGYYVPWDEDVFNRNLKTMSQFEEALVYVNTGKNHFWFSPSKRYLKPGAVDWSAKGIKIFLIDQKVAGFKKIPLDKYINNVSQVEKRVSFDTENDVADIREHDEYNPYTSYYYRSRLGYLDKSEWRDFIQNDLKDDYGDDVELISFEVKNFDDFEKPLIIEKEFRFPYEFEEAGDQILFRFPAFEKHDDNPFDSEERESRICFEYPYVYKQKLIYELPSGMTFDGLPDNVSIDEGLMSYSIMFNKADNNTFVMENIESLRGNMIRKEAHRLLKDIYDRMIKSSHKVMILKSME